MRLTYKAGQTIGARDEQQDDYCLRRFVLPGDAETGVWTHAVVLADGMGGHNGGREASKTAVSSFVQALESVVSFERPTLRDCVDSANWALKERVKADQTLRGMGTTLIGAVIRQDELNWISIGDSLLLLLDGENLRRVNRDHSMAYQLDQMARMGEITPEAAQRDPRRHALLDALRGQDIQHIDDRREPMPLRVGDRFLIASDGIQILPDEEIYRVLVSHRDDDQAVVDEILERVDQAGDLHQDNATCVVISVHEDLPDEPIDS
ncbi:MAG: protein phosphatase 2C domain-containing protein [Pseudomonadota bacterium]